MHNKPTGLPIKLEKMLIVFSQVVEIKGEWINSLDINSFAKIATPEQTVELLELIEKIEEEEINIIKPTPIEEPILIQVINIVKGK